MKLNYQSFLRKLLKKPEIQDEVDMVFWINSQLRSLEYGLDASEQVRELYGEFRKYVTPCCMRSVYNTKRNVHTIL